MRIVALSLLFLSVFTLAGRRSKAARRKSCRANTTPNTRPSAKDCLEEDNSGATRLLTGQNLTKEQMAEPGAKKKERDARSEPRSDRLVQLQNEILAAQQ